MKQIVFWSMILFGISLCIYTDSLRVENIQEVELIFYKQSDNGIVLLDEYNNEYFIDNKTLETSNVFSYEEKVLLVDLNEHGEILTIKN